LKRTSWKHALLAAGLLLAAQSLWAHSFSTPYLLPIPYWLYVYGCGAALIVTFAAMGVFAGTAGHVRDFGGRIRDIDARWQPAFSACVIVLRIGALGFLALAIFAGFSGSEDPGRNVALPLFWVVFLLGWSYVTFFLGDLYPFMSPWNTLVDILEKLGVRFAARLHYPTRLGSWPAFALYLALIWVELFIAQSPSALASMLSAYTVFMLLGAFCFGRDVWFGHADFFAVFFRLIGKMAPVAYERSASSASWQLRLRWPFSGLLNEVPRDASVLLFVLFMLSSTAYDGIYATQLWTALFWRNAMTLLQPLWGDDLGMAQAMLMDAFVIYRKVGLLIFPFLYLAVYLLALLLAKILTRSTLSIYALAMRFCLSLIPIAFAYHVAHYYTFLIVQFDAFPSLLREALGFSASTDDIIGAGALEMGLVWHTQVAVVLLGHVLSVVVAHYESLRVFPRRREAIVSQLPLLVLMVAYTTLGLWILTLPLS
jgi:hypothetical protein